MQRYLIVKGVPRRLVSDPTAERRYVGMQRDPESNAEHFCDRFTPTVEAIRDHGHIRKAIASGDLESMSERPVMAEGPNEALASLRPNTGRQKKGSD